MAFSLAEDRGLSRSRFNFFFFFFFFFFFLYSEPKSPSHRVNKEQTGDGTGRTQPTSGLGILMCPAHQMKIYIGTRLVSISTRLVSFAPCFGLQMREWLSPTEACLAVASIGPLLVSMIGTRLFRLLRASVRRCGNGFLFSQRPRPVSLWNEVPLTLIARRWPCAFFFIRL